MLQLGQLDLKFPFVAPRPLSKDVENQTRPVKHAALQVFFEVSFLTRAQGVIEEYQFCPGCAYACGNLLELSATDKMVWRRLPTSTAYVCDRGGPGGPSQLLKLRRVIALFFRVNDEMD